MKLLAICGSPRKGGTYKLLNSMKEKFPDIDYEILLPKDMVLKDCYGCYKCINRGPEYCPLKDDRDIILKKMEEANGIIFATPTHTRHISALMKKFVDTSKLFAVSFEIVFCGWENRLQPITSFSGVNVV